MQPIKTALCSFGMSGYVFHAPLLAANPNFILSTVWERTKNEAEKQYPDIHTVRTFDELLSDEQLQLVVVNTPSITHFDYTKKALEAGKHVVVEKPFTATVKQAETLMALANKKNLYLTVFHNRRWDSDFKTVKKILDAKVLGEITDVEIHYDRFEPALSAKTHKEEPTAAVGSIYDLGSHLIDQALQLFGKPNALFADADSYRPNSKVIDYFDIKLFYNHFRVALKSSYFVKEPTPAYVIHGTKGSFLKSRADIQEAALKKLVSPLDKNWGMEPVDQQGVLHTISEGESIKKRIISEKGNYMDFYDQLYDAIMSKGPLPVQAEEAKNCIEIIELAYQSINEKRIVSL